MLHDPGFFQRPEVASAHIMQGDEFDMTAAGKPLFYTNDSMMQTMWQIGAINLLEEHIGLLGWELRTDQSIDTEPLPAYNVPGAK